MLKKYFIRGLFLQYNDDGSTWLAFLCAVFYATQRKIFILTNYTRRSIMHSCLICLLIETYSDFFRRAPILLSDSTQELLGQFSANALFWIILMVIGYIAVCIYNLADPNIPLLSEAARLNLKYGKYGGLNISD